MNLILLNNEKNFLNCEKFFIFLMFFMEQAF